MRYLLVFRHLFPSLVTLCLLGPSFQLKEALGFGLVTLGFLFFFDSTPFPPLNPFLFFIGLFSLMRLGLALGLNLYGVSIRLAVVIANM